MVFGQRVKNSTLVAGCCIAFLWPAAGRADVDEIVSGDQETAQGQVENPPPQPGQLPPAEQPGVKAPGKTAQGEDKRIFGVLPNYRTAEMSAKGTPISASR